MGMHAYHDRLPGFNSAQLLVDECPECEARSLEDSHGIAQLDQLNFIRAWHRAAEWGAHGAGNIAAAEAPMLNVLWAIQLRLERLGVPIGVLPRGPILPQIDTAPPAVVELWSEALNGPAGEGDQR